MDEPALNNKNTTNNNIHNSNISNSTSSSSSSSSGGSNYVGSAWTISSNSNMWWQSLLPQPKQFIPNYPAVVWPKDLRI
jgi:hypothetical protein